jgi:activator of HSP90 ATPase
MKTKAIKQTVKFAAKPIEVYEQLMDAKKHSAFTGTKATMSKKPKGKFSVYDGYCHGFNIELIEGKKILQAWHFAEEGWPDDHYSICLFDFKKDGTGTKLSFVQTDVPEHKVNALKDGWKTYYWKPIKDALKNKK